MFCISELWIEMIIWSSQFFWPYFSTGEKGLNKDSNIVLCDAGAMLHQLNYLDNLDLVFTWFHTCGL